VEWRIRRATPEDAPALSLLASATFLETFVDTRIGSDIVTHCALNNRAESFARWAANPAGAVLLATSGTDAPLGYAVLVVPDLPVEPGPADIELKRLYALSRTHGSGLGRELLVESVAAARGLGRTRMLLGTAPWNARACAFYEREGFVRIGERQFRVGDSIVDDVVYARDL
jgi:diamine N-acetyltransferase